MRSSPMRQKRATYDQYGHAGVEQGRRFLLGASAAPLSRICSAIFSAIFSAAATARGRRGRRGDDLRYNLTISFEEAAFGLETKIQIPRHQSCATCQRLAAPSRAPRRRVCATCRGSGQVRFQQGFFSLTRPCPECNGDRQDHRASLPRLPRHRPGAQQEDPFPEDPGRRGERQPPQAQQRRGGRCPRRAAGRSLCRASVSRTTRSSSREGQDVICEVPISFPQAALGCELEVPTLDGKVRIKVPPGTRRARSCN